ncbi:MAG: acyl-CoA dehydrogenase family protein [Pseudomonadota bacterium]
MSTLHDSDRALHRSSTAEALEAAGDRAGASDIRALDADLERASQKARPTRISLVERLIFGPPPDLEELSAGGTAHAQNAAARQPMVQAAIARLSAGEAFTADGKLSAEIRRTVSAKGGYGFTVPAQFGGIGETYQSFAVAEEELAANGLGALAVEISGHLTIGSGSLLGYGSKGQKITFLPMIAEGTLMGFALTEVGVGVNAKKIRAYVELDANGVYRLFAEGTSNKLWITNAVHGALLAVVARIGAAGDRIGLFILQLPDTDIAGPEFDFRCTPSDVGAFLPNHNSRLHFRNFPIPAENRIPAEGVEVLFYCLKFGRCMLAAMSAGYQRMLAFDAARYARTRDGVGGKVFNHEIPRLAIARMLGGALQAQALAHISLAQEASGADLTGLRDLTKSAAATAGLESMIACEHVVGGRAFSSQSRIHAARANLHLFGVVEGEDNMIRLGMVRDVTLPFVNRYLAPLLGILGKANATAAMPILAIDLATIRRHPSRVLGIVSALLGSATPYRLASWVLREGCRDAAAMFTALVPSAWHSRYRTLPTELRPHARYAERHLRRLRWTYLRLALYYQLELTRAQIPLLRLGLSIEHLVSMLVCCHHAAKGARPLVAIADLQARALRGKFAETRLPWRLATIDHQRRLVGQISDDIAAGRSTLLHGIEPEQFAHDWCTPQNTTSPIGI